MICPYLLGRYLTQTQARAEFRNFELSRMLLSKHLLDPLTSPTHTLLLADHLYSSLRCPCRCVWLLKRIDSPQRFLTKRFRKQPIARKGCQVHERQFHTKPAESLAHQKIIEYHDRKETNMPSASSSKPNGGAEASSSTAAPSPTLYVKNIEGKVKKPGKSFPSQHHLLLHSSLPLTHSQTFFHPSSYPLNFGRVEETTPFSILHLRSYYRRRCNTSILYARTSIHCL